MSKASQKGTAFETLVTRHLRETLGAPDIDRRVKRGKHDTGDVSGVYTADGRRVVLECKNHKTAALSSWLEEAATEAANDAREHSAIALGVVVHKRHGRSAAAEQYVTMTLETFAQLIR